MWLYNVKKLYLRSNNQVKRVGSIRLSMGRVWSEILTCIIIESGSRPDYYTDRAVTGLGRLLLDPTQPNCHPYHWVYKVAGSERRLQIATWLKIRVKFGLRRLRTCITKLMRVQTGELILTEETMRLHT